MPRPRNHGEPKAINTIVKSFSNKPFIEIATSNENKLREIKRLIPNIEIRVKDLKIDEVQSLDPLEVAKKKAVSAWGKNGYNPILVEDTSLEIAGLNGRPGTYAEAFTKDPGMREIIVSNWLKNKDRRAIARVTLAIYDGQKTHLFTGKTSGRISQKLLGGNNFSWDDMFIPDHQKGKRKTFAQMSGREKDKFSMRAKAVLKLKKAKIPTGNRLIWQLDEPYAQELERPQIDKLQNKGAIQFAFSLECLEKVNRPNKNFLAPNYLPLCIEEKSSFYTRYFTNLESASLGLILTDVDRANIKLYENGEPLLWQMGPERRKLALMQRAEFFLKNHNPRIYDYIKKLETKGVDWPARPNRRHAAIDRILGLDESHTKSPIYAVVFKELGYRKQSADQLISRTEIAENFLFNKIGKYPRRVIGLGSMPQVSGQRDVVITAAIGHMPIFITRNGLFVQSTDRQIKLAKQAKSAIEKIFSQPEARKLAERNIGVSLGIDDPTEIIKEAKKIYDEAEIRLFRIYTIGCDPRVIELARLLRKTLGSTIEIFVGQITDKKQALRLIEKDIAADALIFGHGGGRQCTSAINGMAISTVEEVYEITRDSHFNNTSILVEGGVGTSLGPVLLLADGVLYNQQLIHGTIEAGDILVENKYGFCQPYHGEASPPTQLVESANPAMRSRRLSWSGRTNNQEGKPGYMYYKEKANSMTFWIKEFWGYAARTLADLGVKDIRELRNLISDQNQEFLRIISNYAAYIATPYGEK